MWTADRLSVQVRTRLDGGRLFVVSNREPYSHQRNGKSIEVVVPPSGLVTALEPVLTACDGTWIAHGSGNADAEVVDAHDRLRVPPDDPRYTLRRVWLTKEEEEGYYYGFANEGLWPLCHIAHTRPMFRAHDWQHYQDVNRKFTDAVLEEIEDVTQAGGAGPGLSLRAAAPTDQGKTAGCARRNFLAYSVAESGSLRHLPLATPVGGRTARSGPDRIPHSVALQQLSADRRSRCGVARGLGALFGAAPEPSHHRPALPDQCRSYR